MSNSFITQACRDKVYDPVDPEVAAVILRPHFDAVRDLFSEFVPPGASEPLTRLADVVFVVDVDRHDTPRHFAACRDDGRQLVLAPEIVDLPVENLVAILAHEFGHAADFAYPGFWRLQPGGPGLAEYLGDPDATKWGRENLRRWPTRGADHIEWTADGIAMAVTGRSVGYGGPCMLQRFDDGVPRPRGLR